MELIFGLIVLLLLLGFIYAITFAILKLIVIILSEQIVFDNNVRKFALVSIPIALFLYIGVIIEVIL